MKLKNRVEELERRVSYLEEANDFFLKKLEELSFEILCPPKYKKDSSVKHYLIMKHELKFDSNSGYYYEYDIMNDKGESLKVKEIFLDKI